MANLDHPSTSPCSLLMKTAAAGDPGSFRDIERGGKRHGKRKRQFDLQCNYTRAGRQHKFGPGAGIFLFVQKLIFISKKRNHLSCESKQDKGKKKPRMATWGLGVSPVLGINNLDRVYE